ncbi:unnamed protein product, partial [Amoebophrya sp. A120]
DDQDFVESLRVTKNASICSSQGPAQTGDHGAAASSVNRTRSGRSYKQDPYSHDDLVDRSRANVLVRAPALGTNGNHQQLSGDVVTGGFIDPAMPNGRPGSFSDHTEAVVVGADTCSTRPAAEASRLIFRESASAFLNAHYTAQQNSYGVRDRDQQDYYNVQTHEHPFQYQSDSSRHPDPPRTAGRQNQQRGSYQMNTSTSLSSGRHQHHEEVVEDARQDDTRTNTKRTSASSQLYRNFPADSSIRMSLYPQTHGVQHVNYGQLPPPSLLSITRDHFQKPRSNCAATLTDGGPSSEDQIPDQMRSTDETQNEDAQRRRGPDENA